MNKPIDFRDIQRLILGWGKKRPLARFDLLRIVDRDAARDWIAQSLHSVGRGHHVPSWVTLSFAFTYAGLLKLGLRARELKGFTAPFREGMTAEHRSRALGDQDASPPGGWSWGHGHMAVDILQMRFRSDPVGGGNPNWNRRGF